MARPKGAAAEIPCESEQGIIAVGSGKGNHGIRLETSDSDGAVTPAHP